MAVTFPTKVEIVSSALIDHLKWSRLFSALRCTRSAWELFFAQRFTSLEALTPPLTSPGGCSRSESTDIQPVKLQGSISLPRLFQLAHYCLSHFPSVLPAWYSSLSFPLLSVLNLLFHAHSTLPPIPPRVHLLSVSSLLLPWRISHTLPSEAPKYCFTPKTSDPR